MFKGSITALITPFENGKVDEDALRRLVEFQIAQGTHGLVPTGTTGESPTLSHDEHRRVVEITIAQTAGRIPVIAGTGSNSTAEAVELTKHAKAEGANGVLVVAPYYNKPTQEGLYQHYKAINDAVDIPIIVYNIPPRSVVDISVATMKRLFALRNIAGVKDATGQVTRITQQRLALGPEFILLSGDDGMALATHAHGGHGCISVTANVAPGLCAQFQNACMAGDFRKALALHDQLTPLHEALFIESSPAPVKYAASRLGMCREDLRLPLTPISEATRRAVDEALVKVGLLQKEAA